MSSPKRLCRRVALLDIREAISTVLAFLSTPDLLCRVIYCCKALKSKGYDAVVSGVIDLQVSSMSEFPIQNYPNLRSLRVYHCRNAQVMQREVFPKLFNRHESLPVIRFVSFIGCGGFPRRLQYHPLRVLQFNKCRLPLTLQVASRDLSRVIFDRTDFVRTVVDPETKLVRMRPRPKSGAVSAKPKLQHINPTDGLPRFVELQECPSLRHVRFQRCVTLDDARLVSFLGRLCPSSYAQFFSPDMPNSPASFAPVEAPPPVRLEVLELMDCMLLINPNVQSSTLKQVRLVSCPSVVRPIVCGKSILRIQIGWCERVRDILFGCDNLKEIDMTGTGLIAMNGVADPEIQQRIVARMVKHFGEDLQVFI